VGYLLFPPTLFIPQRYLRMHEYCNTTNIDDTRFWVPRAQDPANQTRSYAVTGHLDRAMRRRNFELLQGHRVTKVLLSDRRQTEGVEVQSRNRTVTRVIQARKEVIMCAGLHSPVILQRSGIGPKAILGAAGIKVRMDLPGVGMNLQDHPTTGLGYSCE
jgi:choline dehydrogenase-like flavoprotein